MQFGAVHESLHGTNRTWRDARDDIMSETHTVADLRLLLTGNEVVCLAKLVRYVREHADQFDDEQSLAESRPGDIVIAAELLEQALAAEGYGYSEGDSP